MCGVSSGEYSAASVVWETAHIPQLDRVETKRRAYVSKLSFPYNSGSGGGSRKKGSQGGRVLGIGNRRRGRPRATEITSAGVITMGDGWDMERALALL